MSSLESLFNPRGIAVVGASADRSRPGGQTVHALNDYAFKGGVFPVNARHTDVAGRRCYASLDEVSEACDLAVIALPAAQVPGVIAQCGRKGIRNAVVLSGGFREAGDDGIRLEAALLRVAREQGVRIIGPNCLGLVNVQAGVYAAFGSLVRPPQLQSGHVSVVVQSGGFGISMVIRCTLAGAGFRYLVASGNESDISMPEIIEAYVDDPETRVILAYMEGVSDGRAFMAAARRALAAGKPIVVLKAGNTEQGKLAAASHTANLTGSYDIYRAAFRQCGVIEVADIDQAVDTVLAFQAGRLPRGRGVALMGGSGGSAAVFSDAADECALNLPAPAPATHAILAASLPALSSLRNPIDYTAGFPRPDTAEGFGRAFAAILADDSIHQLGVMFAPIMGAQLKLGAELLAKAAAASDKPVFVFSAMNTELAPEGLGVLCEAGVPVLPSPRRVALAMRALADYAVALRDRYPDVVAGVPSEELLLSLQNNSVSLNEVNSKNVIRSCGIPVTRDWFIPIADTGVLPDDIVFPVAAKIVSADIAHKTDIGAVRLNLADPAALTQAIAEIQGNVRRAAPAANVDGILVSTMVTDGLETMLGVINDPGFGPVVAFGLGGILAETLNDISYRIAPFGLHEAHRMIGELRAAAIFSGLRGRAPSDVDALANAIVAVSELAWQLRDRLAELDINPLLVRPAGAGVVAADAMVILKSSLDVDRH